MEVPFTIEYCSTRNGYLAQYEAVNGQTDWRWWRLLEWNQIVYLFLPPLIALVAALLERNAFLLCVVCFTGLSTARHLGYRIALHRYKLEKVLTRHVGKEIRLVFTEPAIVEHDSGVESTAPWSALKNFWNHCETICIEFANGAWAVIPKETVRPSEVSFDQIEALLLRNNVVRQTRLGRKSQ